jgi:hypothetical protein
LANLLDNRPNQWFAHKEWQVIRQFSITLISHKEFLKWVPKIIKSKIGHKMIGCVQQVKKIMNKKTKKRDKLKHN